MSSAHRSPGMRVRLNLRYSLKLLRSIAPALAFLGLLLVLGTLLIWQFYSEGKPSLPQAFIHMYFLMLAEPTFPDVPKHWVVDLVGVLAPLVGIVVVFDLLARFSLHVFSKKNNQREWVNVVASTYRNHIVLCGLGKVGTKVFEELLALDEQIVCIERDESARGVRIARATDHPVIIDDVRDDRVLLDAGIERAKTVLAVTDEDLINIEVALDARKYNKDIRVIARIFEAQLGQKMSDAFGFDGVYSTSGLAAPFFAVSSLDAEIINSFYVGERRFVVASAVVKPDTPFHEASIRSLFDSRGFSITTVERDGGPLKLSSELILKDRDRISFQCSYEAFREYRGASGFLEHKPNGPFGAE